MPNREADRRRQVHPKSRRLVGQRASSSRSRQHPHLSIVKRDPTFDDWKGVAHRQAFYEQNSRALLAATSPPRGTPLPRGRYASAQPTQHASRTRYDIFPDDISQQTSETKSWTGHPAVWFRGMVTCANTICRVEKPPMGALILPH
jgi:hypothetical protein